MSTRAVIGYKFATGLKFITLVHDGYPSRVIPILEHIINRDGVEKAVTTLISETVRGWWYLRAEQDPGDTVPAGEPVAELVGGYGGRLSDEIVGDHMDLSYIMEPGSQGWIDYIYEIKPNGDIVCKSLEYKNYLSRPVVTDIKI